MNSELCWIVRLDPGWDTPRIDSGALPLDAALGNVKRMAGEWPRSEFAIVAITHVYWSVVELRRMVIPRELR